MEFILLIVIVGSFIGNALLMRFFLKKLIDKVSFSFPQQPAIYGGFYETPSAKKEDAPASNEVMKQNDAGEIEFSEQTIGNIPLDVKIELEGGDTQVPPEYAAK